MWGPPYGGIRNRGIEALLTILFPAPRRPRAVMVALIAVLGPVESARAQNSQPPATIPGLDSFTLATQPVPPTPVPTPDPSIKPLPRPTPVAIPTVTPMPMPSPVGVVPPPLRPTLRPKPAPSPASTPSARPSVAATPVPHVTPSRTPTPQRAPITVKVTSTPATDSATGSRAFGLWATGIALLAVFAGVLLYWRQRKRDDASEHPAESVVRSMPPSEPAPLTLSEVVATPRARIGIALDVKRAGTNLLSAAVEYRVVLHNAGDADARGIALDLRLFGIEPGLERTLEGLFAASVEQPVVARFDLAAGATAALEGTAMLPRDAMPPLAVQGLDEGKKLFVPVMTVALDYGWDGGAGRSAASFVVGLDRGAEAKLGPFRLDGAPRMYDRVRHLAFTVSRTT